MHGAIGIRNGVKIVNRTRMAGVPDTVVHDAIVRRRNRAVAMFRTGTFLVFRHFLTPLFLVRHNFSTYHKSPQGELTPTPKSPKNLS